MYCVNFRVNSEDKLLISSISIRVVYKYYTKIIFKIFNYNISLYNLCVYKTMYNINIIIEIKRSENKE